MNNRKIGSLAWLAVCIVLLSALSHAQSPGTRSKARSPVTAFGVSVCKQAGGKLCGIGKVTGSNIYNDYETHDRADTLKQDVVKGTSSGQLVFENVSSFSFNKITWTFNKTSRKFKMSGELTSANGSRYMGDVLDGTDIFMSEDGKATIYGRINLRGPGGQRIEGWIVLVYESFIIPDPGLKR